jgi:hypothetical protein
LLELLELLEFVGFVEFSGIFAHYPSRLLRFARNDNGGALRGPRKPLFISVRLFMLKATLTSIFFQSPSP